MATVFPTAHLSVMEIVPVRIALIPQSIPADPITAIRAMKKKKYKAVSTAGVITPASWDEDGNVLGISIHALDEKEYLIDPDQIGERLRKLLYEKLEVTGTITDQDEQKPVIQVTRYKIIDAYHEKEHTDFAEEPF